MIGVLPNMTCCRAFAIASVNKKRNLTRSTIRSTLCRSGIRALDREIAAEALPDAGHRPPRAPMRVRMGQQPSFTGSRPGGSAEFDARGIVCQPTFFRCNNTIGISRSVRSRYMR